MEEIKQENDIENVSETVQEEEEKVQLTQDDILNFQPSIDYKGYSPVEVDKFLDTVMGDYAAFEAKVADLEKQLAQAKDENARIAGELEMKESSRKELQARAEELQTQLADAQKAAEEAQEKAGANSFTGGTQVDMLRRIARLENAVFGSGK